MKELIIISRCQKIRKLTSQYKIGEFHFRGVYSGDLVKKLSLKIKVNEDIRIDSDYILQVRFIEQKGHILSGEVLKIKNLDHCFCRD